MLYEALTGAKPYTGPTPLALARAVEAGRPPPIRSLRPDAPLDLVTTIERAMEKNPSRRFADARAMAAALTARSPAPGVGGEVTEPIGSTRAFEATTQQGAGGGDPTARLRALLGRQHLPTLVFAGIVLAAVVLALAFTGRNDPPGSLDATPTPVATPVAGGDLPAELDEALAHLEEVVRP